MITSDTQQSFLELVGLDNEQIESLRRAEGDSRKRLLNWSPNLHLSNVYFSKDYIVFDSEDDLKNWNYYAGFEYIKDDYDMIKVNGDFMAVMSAEIGRVGQILDQYFNFETEEEEEEEEDEEEEIVEE